MRNVTADLYSGATSGSFGNYPAAQRRSIDQKKKEAVNRLSPGFEQLIKDIDSEIDRQYKLAIATAKAYRTEDETRFKMAALSMYIDFLEGRKSHYLGMVKGVKQDAITKWPYRHRGK